MNTAEIAMKWGKAHLEGDWELWASLTADDFQLIGPSPEPLDKQNYLQWCQSLLAANPDLNNNFEVTDQSEGTARGWLQMQGTNTGDWDLTFMGLGVIPATGMTFKNPKEEFVISCRDGQVTKCEVLVPEGSGIAGIFAQLGIGE